MTQRNEPGPLGRGAVGAGPVPGTHRCLSEPGLLLRGWGRRACQDGPGSGGQEAPTTCSSLFKKISSKRRMQSEVRRLPQGDGSLRLHRLPGNPLVHLCVSISPTVSLLKAVSSTAHSVTAAGPRPTPSSLRTLRPALAALSRVLHPDLALGDPSFIFFSRDLKRRISGGLAALPAFPPSPQPRISGFYSCAQSCATITTSNSVIFPSL